MMEPGKKLARLRKEKGLTQKALAELAGTKHGYLCDIERGKQPGIEVSSKLARVLDIPLDAFWKKKLRNGLKKTRKFVNGPLNLLV